MATPTRSGPGVGRRLGYLFKHAHLEMEARNDAALAPLGIDSRELGILLAIAGEGAPSQHEVARRLGIDRTTMVARIDGLEAKGIVARRADALDRRRNVVEVTTAGAALLASATAASDAAEAEMLAQLGPADAEQLRTLLRRVVPAP